MEIVKCKNGHFYDCSKYSKCPHCGIGIEIKRESAVTVANDDPGEQRTVAKSSEVKKDPLREAMTEAHRSSEGAKTVGFYSRRMKADPVVGWLVCITGPERGRDYRLRCGRNYIGRSAKMDVCMFDDEQISRNNHASIIYEPQKSEFFIVGGEGSSIALNGTEVLGPKSLNDGDIIMIGATSLEFVAYCKGGSKWGKE